ncbi:hypothetical protein Y032_0470g2035 [Ancylostoma ceylanicum]|uniref:Uncharacterized protein n=1 Tax=Ancylostoma ceylanicum TaxID=53326 RepID=A0A016WX64_9BILA|nr:hypothetical protein Y032_0470g2035 [Ancylostoma ceylanicum]
MFDCSRVVALLLAKFGQGDVTNATRQESKMAEAFERVLLDAAHCDLTIEDEEDLEEDRDNDEKMDVNWEMDCEDIETHSSPSNAPFIVVLNTSLSMYIAAVSESFFYQMAPVFV